MKRVLPIVLLIALLALFSILGARVKEVLPGFGPLPAVFFCVAACMGMRWLWIPMLAWVVSYPITNAIHGYGWDWQMSLSLLGFGLVVWIGYSLRGKRALALLGGSLGAGVLFYVVTNSGAWLILPDYPKTWLGFVQAQWTGAPHHAVGTWVFLRSALVANVLFTSLFLLGQRQWKLSAAPEPEGELVPVRVRR